MLRCSRLPPVIASPVFNAFRRCWIPSLCISASVYAPLCSSLSQTLKPGQHPWISPMSVHPSTSKLAASFSSAGGSADGRELLVQHLLVKEDDIKLLSDLQQRIVSGEDLSDLAVEYSLCPSKEEGGMLGWVRKGQMFSSGSFIYMGENKGKVLLSANAQRYELYYIGLVTMQVPEFEEAAFNAPLNKVVKCKTKFGWHLLQVLSEREEPVLLDIQPEELHLKMQDPNFFDEAQLIDVREPEEVDQASLPDFQILPLRQFGSWGPDVTKKFDPQKEIYVMCHHGVRSLQVAKYLQTQGFKKVYNVSGGIHAYSLKVDSSIPTY